MSKEREKVKCKTKLEFITEVADDCVANLKDKDREHLIRNPYAIDYHFSYCLYIRNHYIHNRDFSDVDFGTEPDNLSFEIIRMIFAKLIPEYDYDNQFIENLFDDKRFIQLRQEYRAIYGDYPVAMVEEYKEGISFEPALFMSEISSSNNVDIDKEIEVSKKNLEKSCAHIEKLLKKLAEKVWRLNQLRQTAEKCGIDYEELIPKIQEIQKILFEDREYIPVEVCLLPYKKAIGQKRYIEYRRRLSKLLEEHPKLMEKLDLSYFNDRVLAKVVLKYRWPLGLLPQYHLAVKEMKIHGDLYRRRTDIVGFVNGIPLLFVELKKNTVDVQNAYDDNYTDYQDTIPHLFYYNAFLMLSNGTEAKVGILGSKYEFFHEWKRLAEEDQGSVALETMLRGICKKENFLDLFENFILFDHSGGCTAKILARNHQYLGVNEAMKAYAARKLNDGKLGVF